VAAELLLGALHAVEAVASLLEVAYDRSADGGGDDEDGR